MKIAVICIVEGFGLVHYDLCKVLGSKNVNNAYKMLKKIEVISLDDERDRINTIARSSISCQLMLSENNDVGIIFSMPPNITRVQQIRQLLASRVGDVASRRVQWYDAKEALSQDEIRLGLTESSGKTVVLLEFVKGRQTWEREFIEPIFWPLIFAFANKHLIQVYLDGWAINAYITGWAINACIKHPQTPVEHIFRVLETINNTPPIVDEVENALKNPTIKTLERLAAMQKLIS